MHMWSTCCADLDASCVKRVTRSGWRHALRQDAGAVGRDPPQIVDARLVDLVERVEDGADEDVAALVRFSLPSCRDTPSDPGCRGCQMPLSSVLPEALRMPSGSPSAWPNCSATAPRALRLLEVAADGGDLRAEHVARPEVLEQRDQIGERLVERDDVAVRARVRTDVHAR